MAKNPEKKKVLQYTILAVITVDPLEVGTIEEVLQKCQEHGTAEVKNVRVVRET